MDYPCAKFGDFSFSRFGFIVQTDRQTDRITEADQRYSHATTFGVRKKCRRVSFWGFVAHISRKKIAGTSAFEA